MACATLVSDTDVFALVLTFTVNKTCQAQRHSLTESFDISSAATTFTLAVTRAVIYTVQLVRGHNQRRGAEEYNQTVSR